MLFRVILVPARFAGRGYCAAACVSLARLCPKMLTRPPGANDAVYDAVLTTPPGLTEGGAFSVTVSNSVPFISMACTTSCVALTSTRRYSHQLASQSLAAT